ncbi:restriction endonuclease subunit S [Mariniblastus sp.]|nr:restriction endonuclease subunit S [Mariniblastus sp.]
MGSEVQTSITLKDALEFIVDNRGKTVPISESGIPLIATNCINNELLFPSYHTERFVSEETFDTWFRSHPIPFDIILTNKGSKNGAICLVPDPVDFCIAQDMVALRADKRVIDPLYLFAALRSRLVQHRMKQLNVDSVIPHFKKTDFNKLHIPLPPRKSQEFIGKMYFGFSSKIELNRRMNETLESMARALFKSWFVDFDPVIDNALAAGNPIPEPLQARAETRRALGSQRKPLPENTQKLFPDAFVFDEEMGWIPEGWSITTFEQLCDARQGKYLPRNRMVEEPTACSLIPVWGGNGIRGYSDELSYDHPITLITCRGSNCGLIKTTKSPAWITNNAFACKSKFGSDYFLYLYFLNQDFSDCVSGSAQPQITFTALRNKTMSYPVAIEICEAFSQVVSNLRGKQFSADIQSKSLTKLRDTLLPKLLSGELRVPEAMAAAEEALS